MRYQTFVKVLVFVTVQALSQSALGGAAQPSPEPLEAQPLGSGPSKPLSVPSSKQRKFITNPWFWGTLAAGVLVLGGAAVTGVVLALRRGQAPAPASDAVKVSLYPSSITQEQADQANQETEAKRKKLKDDYDQSKALEQELSSEKTAAEILWQKPGPVMLRPVAQNLIRKHKEVWKNSKAENAWSIPSQIHTFLEQCFQCVTAGTGSDQQRLEIFTTHINNMHTTVAKTDVLNLEWMMSNWMAMMRSPTEAYHDLEIICADLLDLTRLGKNLKEQFQSIVNDSQNKFAELLGPEHRLSLVRKNLPSMYTDLVGRMDLKLPSDYSSAVAGLMKSLDSEPKESLVALLEQYRDARLKLQSDDNSVLRFDTVLRFGLNALGATKEVTWLESGKLEN